MLQLVAQCDKCKKLIGVGFWMFVLILFGAEFEHVDCLNVTADTTKQ